MAIDIVIVMVIVMVDRHGGSLRNSDRDQDGWEQEHAPPAQPVA